MSTRELEKHFLLKNRNVFILAILEWHFFRTVFRPWWWRMKKARPNRGKEVNISSWKRQIAVNRRTDRQIELRCLPPRYARTHALVCAWRGTGRAATRSRESRSPSLVEVQKDQEEDESSSWDVSTVRENENGCFQNGNKRSPARRSWLFVPALIWWCSTCLLFKDETHIAKLGI